MSEIIVLNAGGQYCHLIARKIRELGVYAEIKEFNSKPKQLKDVKGIILSGGPDSVYEPNSPKFSRNIFDMGIPVLGICYSHQLMAQAFGGKVTPSQKSEYGIAKMNIIKENSIFNGLGNKQKVWMSHGDSIYRLPKGFDVLSESENCKVAAMANDQKKLYGLQFHPEVVHTTHGKEILENFVFDICAIKGKNWDPKKRINSILSDIKAKVKERKVFFLISGGIDSTVAFILCAKALNKQNVKGIYVDTGFMRKDETDTILKDFKNLGFESVCVNHAKNKFINALKNVFDPEEKRKIIGRIFVEIKNKEFKKLKTDRNEWFFGQGTIYPDTIESGFSSHSAKIKTHHNRVEEIVKLIRENKIVEPLSEFYKDEVRELARSLNLPTHIVNKEPFPGPGLAVRCICSDEKRNRMDDKELSKILSKYGLKGFVAPIKTVGVQGDFRSYNFIAVIYGDIDFENLGKVSTSITNNINTINRVAYIVKAKKGVIIDEMKIKKALMGRKRIELLQEADYIVRKFTDKHREQLPKIWQFPVILFPLGYKRGESIALRPIQSTDGMTANFAKINKNLLKKLSTRILKLNGISAILYDVTNKPPATIEWE